MQGKDHNLILGIGFIAEFVIFLLTSLLIFAVFALQIGVGIKNNLNFETLVPVIGIYLVSIALPLIISIAFGIASYRMLKNRNNARIWGIISSILSLPMIIPLGLIIGIYGLWFFFSEAGRQYYQSNNQTIYNRNQP